MIRICRIQDPDALLLEQDLFLGSNPECLWKLDLVRCIYMSIFDGFEYGINVKIIKNGNFSLIRTSCYYSVVEDRYVSHYRISQIGKFNKSKKTLNEFITQVHKEMPKFSWQLDGKNITLYDKST